MRCTKCQDIFTCTLWCNTESKACQCSKCALESIRRFLRALEEENLEHYRYDLSYSTLLKCYPGILKELVVYLL